MQQSIRSRGFSWLKFLIILVILDSAAYAWQQHQAKRQEADSAQQYITEKVRRGDLSYLVNASGKVYPQKIVQVGAQVSGEIAQLHVEIGDTVKAGDVIAEIDARSQENAKSTAEAQLNSQQAALARAQSTLTQAQQAYNRANNLYKQGAGSKEAQENALASLNSAKNAVIEAQANIRQSELTIANANLNLGYTQVRAPIDGTVIAVAVEEGQSVNAVQSSPTIVTLARTDVMTIKAEIAEADIAVMKVGLPVKVVLLGKNSQSYQGVLSAIDPAPKEISDNGSISSSSAIYYYGHIDVDNAEGFLRYGMTATIAIEVDKAEDALLIPMTAIEYAPNGEARVSVLVNAQAEKRHIEVGLEDGVQAQVLSGLQEGEAVIVSHGGASPHSPMGPRIF